MGPGARPLRPPRAARVGDARPAGGRAPTPRGSLKEAERRLSVLDRLSAHTTRAVPSGRLPVIPRRARPMRPGTGSPPCDLAVPDVARLATKGRRRARARQARRTTGRGLSSSRPKRDRRPPGRIGLRERLALWSTGQQAEHIRAARPGGDGPRCWPPRWRSGKARADYRRGARWSRPGPGPGRRHGRTWWRARCPARQVVPDVPSHRGAPDVTRPGAADGGRPCGPRRRAGPSGSGQGDALLTEVRQTVADLGEELGGGSARKVPSSRTRRSPAGGRPAHRPGDPSSVDGTSKGAERRPSHWPTTRALVRFDEARDALVALGPPAADRDNLAAAWVLVTWAVRPVPPTRTATEARAEVEQAEPSGRPSRTIRETCAELDVFVGDRTPRDAATEARERRPGSPRRRAGQGPSKRPPSSRRSASGLVGRDAGAEEQGRHLGDRWVDSGQGRQSLSRRPAPSCRRALLAHLGHRWGQLRVVDHANAGPVRGRRCRVERSGLAGARHGLADRVAVTAAAAVPDWSRSSATRLPVPGPRHPGHRGHGPRSWGRPGRMVGGWSRCRL
jgi:hypothetical protein